MVTTMAAARAASAAVGATVAPNLARSRAASWLRFQTNVGIPDRSAEVAMPWPMAPMPRIAIGSYCCAIDVLAGGA